MSGLSPVRVAYNPPMNKQRFNSVWGAIEDTPGDAANANMKTHAELMRGKLAVFSLDTLFNMLAAAENGWRCD